MNRRDLMLLLADGAAFLFWTVAHAQEPGRVYRLGMVPQFCVDPLAGNSLLYGVSARQEGPGCHQMGFEERIGRPIYVAW